MYRSKHRIHYLILWLQKIKDTTTVYRKAKSTLLLNSLSLTTHLDLIQVKVLNMFDILVQLTLHFTISSLLSTRIFIHQIVNRVLDMNCVTGTVKYKIYP